MDRSPAKTGEVPTQRGPEDLTPCSVTVGFLIIVCGSWIIYIGGVNLNDPCRVLLGLLMMHKAKAGSFTWLCAVVGPRPKCIFLNCSTQVLGAKHSCLDSCLCHLPYPSRLIPSTLIVLPSGTLSLVLGFFLIPYSLTLPPPNTKFDFMVN